MDSLHEQGTPGHAEFWKRVSRLVVSGLTTTDAREQAASEEVAAGDEPQVKS